MDEQRVWCRPVLARETALIDQATELNNFVWGDNLRATADQFRGRAEHGYLVAAFTPEGLAGTISGIELPSGELAKIGTEPTRLATWDGASGNGTFENAVPGADTLCCVAVTSRTATPALHKPQRPLPSGLREPYGSWAARLMDEAMSVLPDDLWAFVRQVLPAYLESNLDPVLRFHASEKGPLPGASVWLPVPGGRPGDSGSLGYNVLMRYPEVTPQARAALLAPSAYVPRSIGEALVLGAARVAATIPTIKWVVPYSRPAALRAMVGRLCARLGGADVPFSRPEEEAFCKKAIPDLRPAPCAPGG
jgi:hypothetical protein